MLAPVSYNKNPHFGANLKSPKLRLSQKDFFIKIRGYGKNSEWAKQIVSTTNNAVEQIRSGVSAENTLKLITVGVIAANKHPLDIEKRTKTGILRTQREGWKCDKETDVFTPYNIGRYKRYEKRMDATYKYPLTDVNPNLAMSFPTMFKDIRHGETKLINSSLDYIFELFQNRFSKFIKKEVKNSDLKEITDIVAEIRWVLAHATPWLRGSDAISNVFMRAMLKAVGVKAHPPAKGISFDFEAYCTNLDEYKKEFSNFFEKPLEVIEK